MIVLSVALMISLYWNQKLYRNTSHIGVTTTQAQMAREIPTTPSPASSPPSTPKPTPFSSIALLRTQLSLEKLNLESLSTDINDLKQQIKNAEPKVIDEEIRKTLSEISSLQSQFNYYQTTQAAANQSAAQQLQYIETLSRQMQSYLTSQIEAGDRNLQAARQNLMNQNMNPTLNTNETLEEAQNKVRELETLVNSLQNQKTLNAAETFAQISQIKNQSSTTENNTNYIQRALQAQVLVLQNNVNRLQSDRERSQNTIASLNRELADRLQRQKEMQARINQLVSQIP